MIDISSCTEAANIVNMMPDGNYVHYIKNEYSSIICKQYNHYIEEIRKKIYI